MHAAAAAATGASREKAEAHAPGLYLPLNAPVGLVQQLHAIPHRLDLSCGTAVEGAAGTAELAGNLWLVAADAMDSAGSVDSAPGKAATRASWDVKVRAIQQCPGHRLLSKALEVTRHNHEASAICCTLPCILRKARSHTGTRLGPTSARYCSSLPRSSGEDSRRHTSAMPCSFASRACCRVVIPSMTRCQHHHHQLGTVAAASRCKP